jgi:hypothetical protein
MDAPHTLRAGGCHWGDVRCQAALPVEARAWNCSMCEEVGIIHLIVPEGPFCLLSGGGGLTSYRFNTGVAEHLVCPVCGVKGYYRPRSNPDGWSLNARCLDEPGALDIRIEAFDGRNWEAHAGGLAHLSQEQA